MLRCLRMRRCPGTPHSIRRSSRYAMQRAACTYTLVVAHSAGVGLGLLRIVGVYAILTMPVAWPHTSCVSVAHSGQLIMLSIPIPSVGAHRSAMQRSVSNTRCLDVVAHRGGSDVGAPMRCSRSRRAPGAAAKSRDGHLIGHQDEAHAINGPSARRDLPARAGQAESDRQPPHVEGGVLGWGRRCGRGDIGPDNASRWWRGVADAEVAQLSGCHNIEFELILCRRHVAS